MRLTGIQCVGIQNDLVFMMATPARMINFTEKLNLNTMDSMHKTAASFLIIIMLASAGMVNAQSRISEGRLTVSITCPDTISAQGTRVKPMPPKEEVVYFKNGKTRTETKSGTGTRVILADTATGDVYSCIESRGRKIALKISRESLNHAKGRISRGIPEIVISGETKLIAGVKCRRATIIYKEKVPPYDVWYTTEVEAPNSTESRVEGLDGYIMESKTPVKGVTVMSTCTRLEKIAVPDSLFRVPFGYKVTDMEELLKKK